MKPKPKRHYPKTHSTFGGVGAIVHICLECGREVINPDWKEEMEVLVRMKRKELVEKYGSA